MKHSFEKWLKEQKENKLMDEQASDIFEESIRCHKASAYRAAIVMGVSAFNIVIRNRIIDQKEKLVIS